MTVVAVVVVVDGEGVGGVAVGVPEQDLNSMDTSSTATSDR